jgi:hypothetical protein
MKDYVELAKLNSEQSIRNKRFHLCTKHDIMLDFETNCII